MIAIKASADTLRDRGISSSLYLTTLPQFERLVWDGQLVNNLQDPHALMNVVPWLPDEIFDAIVTAGPKFDLYDNAFDPDRRVYYKTPAIVRGLPDRLTEGAEYATMRGYVVHQRLMGEPDEVIRETVTINYPRVERFQPDTLVKVMRP